MCEKYHQELLGSIPLEPSVGQVCEEGKSIVKERPESQSAKKLLEISERRAFVNIGVKLKLKIDGMAQNSN